jgi:hypothetical protein
VDRAQTITNKDNQRHAGAGRVPLLARLPDVTDEMPAATQSQGQGKAAFPLEYRFDPPQTRSAEPAVRVESRWRELRTKSRVLPSSNPFAIPAQTLQHTLAPAVRFLMLVALFTVAGTIILLSRSEKRSTLSSQPKVLTQQSLQPVVTAMETTPRAATAQGPIDSADSAIGESNVQTLATPGLEAAEKSVPAAEAPAAEAVSQTVHENLDVMGEPQVGIDMRSGDAALPQVQTAEPPRAGAHLSGFILEVPARQASNDDDQSSVY